MYRPPTGLVSFKGGKFERKSLGTIQVFVDTTCWNVGRANQIADVVRNYDITTDL